MKNWARKAGLDITIDAQESKEVVAMVTIESENIENMEALQIPPKSQVIDSKGTFEGGKFEVTIDPGQTKEIVAKLTLECTKFAECTKVAAIPTNEKKPGANLNLKFRITLDANQAKKILAIITIKAKPCKCVAAIPLPPRSRDEGGEGNGNGNMGVGGRFEVTIDSEDSDEVVALVTIEAKKVMEIETPEILQKSQHMGQVCKFCLKLTVGEEKAKWGS